MFLVDAQLRILEMEPAGPEAGAPPALSEEIAALVRQSLHTGLAVEALVGGQTVRSLPLQLPQRPLCALLLFSARESAGLQALLDAAPDQMLALSLDQRVLSANQAWREQMLCRYGRLPAAGETWLELLSQLAAAPAQAAEARAELHAELGLWRYALGAEVPFEVQQRRRQGEGWRYERIRCLPLRDNGGRRLGVLSIRQDISGEVEAGTGLLRDLGRLGQSLERQELFLRSLVHDVHGPMAGMQTALRLAAQDQAVADSRFFPVLEHCMRHLDEVIASLTDFLELQRGGPERPQLQSFERLLTQVEQGLAGQIGVSQARIAHRFEVASIAYLGVWLQSMLRNLLGNALKYAEPGRRPEILVETRALDQGRVCLSVHDNGRGFPGGRVPARLFEPCQRFHAGMPGKGLGLYLLRTMLEKNGGSISAEVRREGVSFHLVLVPM